MKKRILITGCAGFIGFHTCSRFLKNLNYKVLGIDNLGNSKMMYPENDYRFQGNKVLELPLK